MSLNVAVQMDPIERINIRGDSTFALLLEAQQRGHAVAYYTPDKLALREGRVFALLTVTAEADAVSQIMWIMNPAKLAAIAPGAVKQSQLVGA